MAIEKICCMNEITTEVLILKHGNKLLRHLDIRRGLLNFLQHEFYEMSPIVDMTNSIKR